VTTTEAIRITPEAKHALFEAAGPHETYSDTILRLVAIQKAIVEAEK